MTTGTQTTRGTPRADKPLRALLADDVEAVRAERGGVEQWHLIERGWSPRDLAAHLPAVCAELSAKAA